MGNVFLEHIGGKKIYSCVKCKTNITNHENIVSTHFQGSTGRAFLFRKAVNLVQGPRERKKLTSGKHWVRDVFCKSCNTRLGWFYELAMNPAQEYKEGMVVLEKLLITESDEKVPDRRRRNRNVPVVVDPNPGGERIIIRNRINQYIHLDPGFYRHRH